MPIASPGALRRAIIGVFVLAVLTACSSTPKVPKTEQLVEDARLTVEKLKNHPNAPDFLPILKDAAGIAVFPAVYKAAFFVGAEAGNGVLLARDKDTGEWGYPAFYTLGSGSFGLQFGGEQAEIVLVIRSLRAVDAIIKHQGKLGADAGVAVGWLGSGLEGAVTTNLGLDVIAFTTAKGLFGGLSLEGTALVRRTDYNTEFYGDGTTPHDIVLEHKFTNPKADGLRAALKIQ